MNILVLFQLLPFIYNLMEDVWTISYIYIYIYVDF